MSRANVRLLTMRHCRVVVVGVGRYSASCGAVTLSAAICPADYFFRFSFPLQVLESAKLKMIRLNCLMHIRWPVPSRNAEQQQQQPVVVRLEEIQRKHLDQLQL